MTGLSSIRVMTKELIGRDVDLRLAMQFLGEVSSGPRAYVIEGDPGVGKTALWDAIRAGAEAQGALVLTARPTQTEAGFAFAALGDLLRTSIATADRLPAPQRRALEVALLLGDHDDEGPNRQAVSLAALGMLRLLSEAAPVVIAVDDAQWLDAPSAEVVRFAARRLGSEPFAFLLTVRVPMPMPVIFEPRRIFDSMPLQVCVLSALPLEAVRLMLKTELSLVLPRPTLRWLFELSGGNPFFALELGRALLAGVIRADPTERLPVTLERLVRERLEALTAQTRRGLAVAALALNPTLDIVEAAAAGTARALSEAEHAQIVSIRDGEIRFTHPLLASGARAVLTPAERREIHSHLAELVDEPEQSARHMALAASGPSEAIAMSLDMAAARAERRGAPASAADLYERAARLTPPATVAAARSRMADSAFCSFRAGDTSRAHRLLSALVEVLPAGPERALVLIRLARVRSFDDDQSAAQRLFLQAIGEAGDDEELVAAAREGAAAVLFRRRRNLPMAIAHATEAARIAESLGDQALAAEALGSQLLAEAAIGHRETESTLTAMLALQAAAASRRILAQPLFQAGVVWLWHDRFAEAEAAFDEMRRRAAEIGDESSLPYVLVLLAQVACVRGQLEVAGRLAELAHELAEQAGQAMLGGYSLAMRSLAHALAGEADAARETGAEALAVARRTSGVPAEQFAAAALGQLELSLGRPEETVRVLQPQVEFIRSQGIVEPGAARFVSDHVEALIELGERTEAEDVLGWYEANAQRLGRRSALAVSARCRAALAALDGRWDAALANLERALLAHGGDDIPLQRARTLLALGAARRREHQKRIAREAFTAAGNIFARAGARIWAERATSELTRIGGRAPSTGQLTPTERRVADLVAQGLSTKRVAAALVVAPKTVEGHLSKIYAKLGVQTRAQLAHRYESGPPE